MEFMTWSHNAPGSSQFDPYMQKINGSWQIVDPNAIYEWSDVRRNMMQMYTKYHEKIKDFGLHEFGVKDNGDIYDYRTLGYNVLGTNDNVQSWVPSSIQYLMETFPNVNYSLQPICFGQKVDKFLHTNTSAIPNFINQLYKIVVAYRANWSQINTIELDFEKIYTLNAGDPIYDDRESPNRVVIGYATGNDWEVYADFIKKIKNEICIPLGMKLRVNMYAMTGDWNPYYYGWHDYKTLASRNDNNGNQAIDEFALMTYDFSWAGSAPGPSTPQGWLEQVLLHVQDSLPEHKTWVGNAGYGRRWGLDNKQRGSVVTFNQITMWQNGMYVHNHNGSDDGNPDQWVWHNQDWLPFTSFNDPKSGYQQTYLHLYDKFKVFFSDTIKDTVNKTTFGGFDLITSYFKSQQPEITGLQSVVNNPVTSGNTSGQYLTGGESSAGFFFPGAYRANRARYQYDENVEACVAVPDDTGVDGKIAYSFNMSNIGSYKLIALVHFNTLDNNVINARLNGVNITIGGSNLPDWFPFYVDKSVWIDVGTFDFQTSNTIEVVASKGYIWGFIVCETFEQKFLGGQSGFNSNLQPFYKRDIQGKPVQANMPQEMTVTGEILRRPPRPAIIFEDNFIHMLSRELPGYNITNLAYYMTTQEYWESGEIMRWHEGDQAYACTGSQGFQMVGFTDGSWNLQEDGSIQSSANVGTSNQLVLYKKFSANMTIRADVNVIGTFPKVGIRMLANREGDSNEGYLALLDYQKNKVVLGYENGIGNFTELASEWMSSSLEGLKGSTVSMYATILDGKVYVRVGDNTYINGFLLSNMPTSGAYGVYVSEGTVNLTMFNVSTIDRYEPLEKMEVEVDGQVYAYGEVDRGLLYDDYGYLIYSGLDIDEGESASLDFETDYTNTPLARIPSWVGDKQVKVKMVDAGIWFRNLYIGDSEGYSVAYNSDYIGFVQTSELINQYKCKGVAMWDIGQEDPLVYTYLPN